MSFRFDSPLIPSAYHFGNRGLGVVGSKIASTGTYGPGYIFASLDLPSDANKEYRGLIVSVPQGGNLFAYEDTSFTYTGPSGEFVFRIYEDGVDLGTATAQITMPTSSSSISWTEDDDISAISTNTLETGRSASIAWTEDNDVSSMSSNLMLTGALNWTEDNDVSSGTASLTTSASISWTEDNDVSSALVVASATPVSVAAVSWTEENDVSSVTAATAQALIGTLAWTEQDDICSVTVHLTGGTHYTEVNDRFKIAIHPRKYTIRINRG